jgi:hypothetical protein
VTKTIRPNTDEAFVVSSHGKKPWPTNRLDWGHDPAELTKAVRTLDRDAGLPDAFNFDLQTDETGFLNESRHNLQTFSAGGVSVFDAVYSMMNSDPRPARRVLAIFRDPWAHSPGYGGRANQAVEYQMQRVIALAQQLHITVFVIGLEDNKYNGITDMNLGKNYMSLHAGDDGGAGSATREYDRRMERERIRAYNEGRYNVQRLASETGGATFWSSKKNFSDAVNSIANQLAGQYIVTFTPSDVPGPVHSLKVTGNNGVRVLAQTVFYVEPAK